MKKIDEIRRKSIIDQLITSIETLLIWHDRNERRITALEEEVKTPRGPAHAHVPQQVRDDAVSIYTDVRERLQQHRERVFNAATEAYEKEKKERGEK